MTVKKRYHRTCNYCEAMGYMEALAREELDSMVDDYHQALWAEGKEPGCFCQSMQQQSNSDS